MAVTKRYSQGCQNGKKMNIIRFFLFKLTAKFAVEVASRSCNIVRRVCHCLKQVQIAWKT